MAVSDARMPRRAPLRSASLLLRTSLTLGISGLAIALVAVVALDRFVTTPIAEQSADDEAALLVLSAQTWVELPPAARPYFELELVESHGLVVSPERQALPQLEAEHEPRLRQLVHSLAARVHLGSWTCPVTWQSGRLQAGSPVRPIRSSREGRPFRRT